MLPCNRRLSHKELVTLVNNNSIRCGSYIHKKTKKVYWVSSSIVLIESTMEPSVVYTDRGIEDPITFVRPVGEFKERFEFVGPKID